MSFTTKQFTFSHTRTTKSSNNKTWEGPGRYCHPALTT